MFCYYTYKGAMENWGLITYRYYYMEIILLLVIFKTTIFYSIFKGRISIDWHKFQCCNCLCFTIGRCFLVAVFVPNLAFSFWRDKLTRSDERFDFILEFCIASDVDNNEEFFFIFLSDLFLFSGLNTSTFSSSLSPLNSKE